MDSQRTSATQPHALHTDADLDPLLDRIGDARYVLLGEASHGTHEYYTWRARISKRLIQEKDFSFIAVEGDWPDCYALNRFVKNYAGTPTDVLEVLPIPPAREGSVEALLHEESTENRLLLFNPQQPDSRLSQERGHRAIGVVYRPERDQWDNYVPTVLARRYDAFIYLDQTRALHPLHIHADPGKMPEGYPFGV